MQEPFQESLRVVVPVFAPSADSSLSVPAQKRLVIRHVSADVAGPTVGGVRLSIRTTIGGTAEYRAFNIVTHPSSINNLQLASHSLLAFGNPGTQVIANVTRSDYAVELHAYFTISGYFVEMA